MSAYTKAKTKAIIRVEDIRKFKNSYSRSMSFYTIHIRSFVDVTDLCKEEEKS